MTLANIQASAMQLAPAERAELLDCLWASLQPEAILQVQQRWAAEAESRIDAVDRGELPTVDGPAALRDLRRSLGA